MSYFNYLLIFLIIFGSNYSFSEPTIIIADGGIIGDFISGDADRMWEKVKLTIFIQHIISSSSIRGSVTHPYGDGPFDLSLAGSETIKKASISTFSEHINFEISFSASAVSSQWTPLFTARPIRLSNSSEFWNLGRSGAFAGNYPYPIHWLSVESYDSQNHPIVLFPKTNPVLREMDVFVPLKVKLEDFDIDTIVSIKISDINHVELFPGWYFEKDNNDTQSDQYSLCFTPIFF